MLPVKLLAALLLVGAVKGKEVKSNCSNANAGLTLVQKRHVSSKLHPDDSATIVVGKAVRFRTMDGKFLHCHRGKVSISDIGSGFVLQKHGSAALYSGDSVTLACSGRQLSILQDQIQISQMEMGDAFILQKQEGDGLLQENDAVYLLSSRFLQALKVEGSELKLRPAEDGTAEAFVVEGLTGNHWVVLPDPDGFCDATLRCHRRLKISCTAPNGTSLNFQDCDHEHRPWSYEPCFKSPMGACIDVAESDCTDVPGSWWNSDGKTCKEYKPQDCHHELVRKACGETCGNKSCRPAKSLPVLEGCKDDPLYRSAFNWHCAWFKQRNCSAYLFRDELMKACRKSCNLCWCVWTSGKSRLTVSDYIVELDVDWWLLQLEFNCTILMSLWMCWAESKEYDQVPPELFGLLSPLLHF